MSIVELSKARAIAANFQTAITWRVYRYVEDFALKHFAAEYEGFLILMLEHLPPRALHLSSPHSSGLGRIDPCLWGRPWRTQIPRDDLKAHSSPSEKSSES